MSAQRSSNISSFSVLCASFSNRSESERTRSTTRPMRVLVEKMSAPQAEMSTAGVIIAVRTARAACGASRRASQSMAAILPVRTSAD